MAVGVAGQAEWLQEVAARTTDHADTVQRLLHAVRTQLGMQVAWTSEFRATEQVFRFVDADPGAAAPEVGSSAPLSGSFCARVLDGRVPALIPDARQDPSLALLDITRELHIGSYLGVPLLAADGTVAGMLCATSNAATPMLSERDLQTMRLLAELLHDLQIRALDDEAVQAGRAQLLVDLRELLEGGKRWPVLQPIIDVRTGETVAVEGLTRFASDRTPAQWFDAAARAGLGAELELAAARGVLDLLRQGAVPAPVAVCVNLSADTLITADLDALLQGVDPARLVIELSEHHPVNDYDALGRALAPWRARGLRLAVDDAGAGYASLQHVLMCAPDVMKLDMALVRGVDSDAVRQALIGAVVAFAGQTGIAVIAEGVETQAEREALVALGVLMLQGFLVGAPEAPRAG